MKVQRSKPQRRSQARRGFPRRPRAEAQTPALRRRSRSRALSERSRRQHPNALEAQIGKREPEHPPGDSQQHALGEQLPQDARATGTERRAHRDLLVAVERPRQQQAGDVGARDQQHERHGADKDDDRRADVPDDLVLQGNDAEGETTVRWIDIRMLLPQPRGQCVHLCLGLRRRDPHLQLREDVVVLAAADLRCLGPERQRQQDLCVGRDAERRHDFAPQ